jgi:hypothetical protein
MGLHALMVSASLGLLAADDPAKAEQDELQGTWPM